MSSFFVYVIPSSVYYLFTTVTLILQDFSFSLIFLFFVLNFALKHYIHSTILYIVCFNNLVCSDFYNIFLLMLFYFYTSLSTVPKWKQNFFWHSLQWPLIFCGFFLVSITNISYNLKRGKVNFFKNWTSTSLLKENQEFMSSQETCFREF